MTGSGRGTAAVRVGEARAPAEAVKERLRVALVGHVDHGKSTLIGRLLHDAGLLAHGKREAIAAMCARRGMPFEWAFLMDAFQAERDQAVTIDSAEIRFRAGPREVIFIDAPGHKEFLRNVVSGAARADAALLVVDAAEGLKEQSHRHAYLLLLLGVKEVAVVVNKMDRVDFAADRFRAVAEASEAYLTDLGVPPRWIIPVAAREGDNLVKPSVRAPWYKGPTVVEALQRFALPAALEALPLRFPVQDVYKVDDRRILVGRVESGRLRVADTLLFSPSNKTARVDSIELWNRNPPAEEAVAGQAIGITLDEPLFVERGELASHLERPPVETNVFRAHLLWLGRAPLEAGKRYKLRLHTSETPVQVEAIEGLIDAGDLSTTPGEAVGRDAFARVVLRTRRIVALDEFAASPRTGRFVLVDGREIGGGGTVSMEGYPDQRALLTVKATNVQAVAHQVTAAARVRYNAHQGGVLWFTGLSGAGKSTLAVELELRLFEKGYQVYVLDGDNVRRGLNANLGFSPEDRAENIRRVGEVAALFADAGLVVITAFISPYRSDRERAGAAMRATGGASFHEVYIKANLEVCEARDPRGLYKKARRGEIPDFTGISAPYEPPETPELVIDTVANDVETCIKTLVDYVERHFAPEAEG
ncbi:MAG: adenylyl-sulfate kinase [Alphaproteobacteria bacterium]